MIRISKQWPDVWSFCFLACSTQKTSTEQTDFALLACSPLGRTRRARLHLELGPPERTRKGFPGAWQCERSNAGLNGLVQVLWARCPHAKGILTEKVFTRSLSIDLECNTLALDY